MNEDGLPELGRLRPPYHRDDCSSSTCGRLLDEDAGAYLFTDLGTRKLVVFCGDCARHVELNCRTSFALLCL